MGVVPELIELQGIPCDLDQLENDLGGCTDDFGRQVDDLSAKRCRPISFDGDYLRANVLLEAFKQEEGRHHSVIEGSPAWRDGRIS